MTKQVDRELFAAFLEEMSGYLPEVERALDAYFTDQSQTEYLHQAHRLMHTICGASAMLGLTELSDAARAIENLLDEVATGARTFEAVAINDTLNGFVFITDQLAVLAATHANHPTNNEIKSPLCHIDENVSPFADEECYILLPSPELMSLESIDFPDFDANALATEVVDTKFDETLPPLLMHDGAAQSDVKMPSDIEFPQFDTPPQFQTQSRSAASLDSDSIAAIDPEMLEVFQEEAEEHLRTMSAGLATLTLEPSNRSVLQEVRRSTHTLKGAAGVVGLMTASRIAHRMEDLLDRLYEYQTSVERGALNLLVRSTDTIENLTRGATAESLRATLDEIYNQYAVILAATTNGEADAASIDAIQSKAVDMPIIAAFDDAPRSVELIDDFIVAQTIDELPVDATLETRERETVSQVSETVNTAGEVADTFVHETGRTPASMSRAVRVPLDRLDRVIKLVGELAISRTTIENYVADLLRENEELRRSTERLRRVSTKLEAEYEARFLHSGAATITRFAHATDTLEATDSFNVIGFSPKQLIEGATWTPPAPANISPSAGESGHGFDELEFDRYTEFHRLSRELAEASTDAAAVHNELGDLHGNFESILLRQRRLTNEIQQGLMRVRMVPLSMLVARAERTVRIVADTEGKSAQLLVEGAHTEFDTTVLAQMTDPLLHILRNSVSHGIERAEVRRALGKPEIGTIRLRAAYEGAQVIIEITDDGAGVDAAAVRTRALETGFLTEERSAQMSDKESLALIFLPGLSTARKVSEISGRGVGMDVVRDSVARLQGTLDLESKPGAGTRLIVRLPLTLAVTRALIVRSQGESYAVPTNAVRQVIRPNLDTFEVMQRDGLLRMNEASYPVIHLNRWLQQTEGNFGESVNEVFVLILHTAERSAALVVDEIVEGREIVVKPLGADLRRMYGVMGATVMGDGRVIPILNPEDIMRGVNTSIVSTTMRRQTGQLALDVLKRAQAAHVLRVMIVDDSPSVRRVMTNLIKTTRWMPIIAKDGLNALEILHNSSADELPSVILLDVEMPRMDGYELLATLRQQETLRHIPVVMITSRTGEKHRSKALNLGASEYLTKPYHDNVLLETIARLGESATLRQRLA